MVDFRCLASSRTIRQFSDQILTFYFQVDDYLKEYNKDEVVTLSGELEIEPNDVENNNGTSKELRHKPRKTRRRTREDTNANGKDVSPKVFKAGSKSKNATKPGILLDIQAKHIVFQLE